MKGLIRTVFEYFIQSNVLQFIIYGDIIPLYLLYKVGWRHLNTLNVLEA